MASLEELIINTDFFSETLFANSFDINVEGYKVGKIYDSTVYIPKNLNKLTINADRIHGLNSGYSTDENCFEELYLTTQNLTGRLTFSGAKITVTTQDGETTIDLKDEKLYNEFSKENCYTENFDSIVKIYVDEAISTNAYLSGTLNEVLSNEELFIATINMQGVPLSYRKANN
jgi:hypothetical protein